MFDNMTTVQILKMFAPLIVINVTLMLFCLFRLTKDRVRYLPKWAWALIVIIFELIGPVSYLMIGRERD